LKRIGRLYRLVERVVPEKRIGRLYPLRMVAPHGCEGEAEDKEQT